MPRPRPPGRPLSAPGPHRRDVWTPGGRGSDPCRSSAPKGTSGCDGRSNGKGVVVGDVRPPKHDGGFCTRGVLQTAEDAGQRAAGGVPEAAAAVGKRLQAHAKTERERAEGALLQLAELERRRQNGENAA